PSPPRFGPRADAPVQGSPGTQSFFYFAIAARTSSCHRSTLIPSLCSSAIGWLPGSTSTSGTRSPDRGRTIVLRSQVVLGYAGRAELNQPKHASSGSGSSHRSSTRSNDSFDSEHQTPHANDLSVPTIGSSILPRMKNASSST